MCRARYPAWPGRPPALGPPVDRGAGHAAVVGQQLPPAGDLSALARLIERGRDEGMSPVYTRSHPRFAQPTVGPYTTRWLRIRRRMKCSLEYSEFRKCRLTVLEGF